MKKITILGSSDLSEAIIKHFKDYQIEVLSRPKCDFLDKHKIKNVAEQIKDSEYIINTIGIYESNDAWDSMIVNGVAPSYLLECLALNKSSSHVISIGSHGSMWTSWPDIDFNRLRYNISKKIILDYTLGLSHSYSSNLILSIINPTQFKTKMSNYNGYDLDVITNAIEHVMNNPVLLYEFESLNAFKKYGQT